MLIYKIFRADEQAAFEAAGETLGAPIDIQDGYVHISTAEQVRETVAKHFAGEDELFILAIDTEQLGDDLKWEVSRGGALFPHLYRKLKLSDVVWTRLLPLGPDGHVFPEECR